MLCERIQPHRRTTVSYAYASARASSGMSERPLARTKHFMRILQHTLQVALTPAFTITS